MIKGKLNAEEFIGENDAISEVVNSIAEQSLSKDKNTEKVKIFQKYSIKDIVFLAIVAAVMVLTCGIMPLFAELTKVLFGIAQLVTGLQMSLFVTVGLMKVRKPFAMTLMLLFMGAIMVMMSPVMGLSNVFISIVAEIFIILVFQGYKSDLACFTAGAIIAPLGLIVPTVWNAITAPEVFAKTIENGWVVFGMTMAVIAISCLGAFLGMKIGKELTKAGVLKNNGKV